MYTCMYKYLFKHLSAQNDYKLISMFLFRNLLFSIAGIYVIAEKKEGIERNHISLILKKDGFFHNNDQKKVSSHIDTAVNRT